MKTWLLETLIWAVVTMMVVGAIWGFTLPNLGLSVGISILVSLFIGNSHRS
ncbi:hypothetical protein [Photobacterium sanctipauli]|uniref:hypothetical protein n=1 Tax=Photobacterium sanctipauli TaxID=1342794 RepID=UPI000B2C3875|nr:hypothetical protein [Photobacterium sanctipauli]